MTVRILKDLTTAITFMEWTDYDGTPLAEMPQPLHHELTREWLDDMAEYLEQRGWTVDQLVDELREHRSHGWRR